MSKRKTISKKTRFEVFKRDSFTCQYCGSKAPDVVLHVDHIHPVAKGGGNDILNLVTSCDVCNSGKSDRLLDDSTAVSKRMTQAATLQERREQIEMIAQWQRGLADIETAAIDEAAKYFSDLVPGWHLSDGGIQLLRPLVAKHGLADTMAAIRSAAATYVRIGEDGKATAESSRIVQRVFMNCLKYKEQNDANPTLASLRYIAGIARNRFPWCPSNHRRFIEEAHTQWALPIETIRQLVLECKNWSQLEVALDQELAQ